MSIVNLDEFRRRRAFQRAVADGAEVLVSNDIFQKLLECGVAGEDGITVRFDGVDIVRSNWLPDGSMIALNRKHL